MIFIRFSLDKKPDVKVAWETSCSCPVTDPIIGRPLEITTDLVTLATAVIPNRDEQLAQLLQSAAQRRRLLGETARQATAPRISQTDGVFLSAWRTTPSRSTKPSPRARPRPPRGDAACAQEDLHERDGGRGGPAHVQPAAASALRSAPTRRRRGSKKACSRARARSTPCCARAAACASRPAARALST